MTNVKQKIYFYLVNKKDNHVLVSKSKLSDFWNALSIFTKVINAVRLRIYERI